MTGIAGRAALARPAPARRPRRRRWLRWVLAGVAAVIVISLAAAAAFIKLQPTPAPLALPSSAAPPAGPLAGRWSVKAGAVAGFRVRETSLGLSNDVVGRTRSVTGSVVLSADRLTAASVSVGLRSLTVSGKRQPQFGTSLGTATHPNATFILARPVSLPAAFVAGRPVTLHAAGRLTMHGITRLVTLTLSARRDGPRLQVAGRAAVPFSAWAIRGPGGLGVLGSLANQGVAEFRLTLQRSPGSA
jgi:polyisoprenoid-binding protein YceI